MYKWMKSVPRRKRMKRENRFCLAKEWIRQYTGKRIVPAYAKWFGVDRLCAIKELRMLGVAITDEYEKQTKLNMEAQQKAKQRRKEIRLERERLAAYAESDENFAFIAGYTEGGAPFGVTWAEWQETEAEPGQEYAGREDDDDDVIPF